MLAYSALNCFIHKKRILFSSYQLILNFRCNTLLHHWRPPLRLSPSMFLTCITTLEQHVGTACSDIWNMLFHISVSLCLRMLFLMDPFSSSPFPLFPLSPFPLPLFSLSLISRSALASVFFKQLVFSWASTSNIHLFKEPKLSHVWRKKEAPESYLPSTATLSPSLSPSLHPALHLSLPIQNAVCLSSLEHSSSRLLHQN